MPSKRVVCECKYCGKEFQTWDECEEHEPSHLRDYSQSDTNEIIRELRWLSDHAYGYYVGDLVAGIPVSDFGNLMDEAAKRLEGRTMRLIDADKVAEQLKEVSYERYGNDGGMGGELVINLDDAIEIVKGGGGRC